MSIEKYNICQICGENNPPENHYYFSHKISIKNYYEKHFSKKDLYSGEKLLFKNLDSYIFNDFIDRKNLIGYLAKLNLIDKWEYLKQKLKYRKLQKNLTYSPTTFEAKSIQFPAPQFFEKTFDKGSYDKFSEECELKCRFNYLEIPVFNNKDLTILIDTREIKPLNLNCKVVIQKLDEGDYTLENNYQNVFVERKEITDWAACMSKEFDRFRRELNRAKEKNKYIIILIEEKYSNLLSINYLPHTKWIKASSDFLMKRVRDLYLEFDNFQMLSVNGRKEMVRVIEKIFKLENIKNFDLMMLYENNLL